MSTFGDVMAQSKDYMVVEFEDGMQLIATKWFNKEAMIAYWPSFTTMSRYYRAVQRLEPVVMSSWRECTVKRILATTDTYENGLKKLKEAEFYSDLNSSDTDGRNIKSRRRINNKMIYSDSDDTDTENVTPSILPPFPTPPESSYPHRTNEHAQSEKKTTHNSLNKATDINPPVKRKKTNLLPVKHTAEGPPYKQKTNELVKQKNFNRADKNRLTQRVDNVDMQVLAAVENLEIPNIVAHAHTSNIKKSQTPSVSQSAYVRDRTSIEPSISTNNADFKTYQQYVVRSFTSLKFKLETMSEAIDEINRKLDSTRQNNIPDRQFASLEVERDIMKYFPLKNLEELETIEEKLTEDIFARQLVRKAALLRIGGSNYKAVTVRIMERMFSNTVAEKFSWLGMKGKKVFSTLHLTRLILDVAGEAKSKKSDLVTDDMVSEVIKAWLRHAKEQLLREKLPSSLESARITASAHRNEDSGSNTGVDGDAEDMETDAN